MAAAGGPEVRPLEPGDDAAVRWLFAQTVGLGRPLPFPVDLFDLYQALCLDWYLGPGRSDAAVAVDDHAVSGYALVCTRPADYERWLRRKALGFLVRSGVAALRPSLSGRFLRLRIVDAWHARRHPISPPMSAHAHLNLAPRARRGPGARMLVEHIDERCRLAGLPGWFGEMNAPAGRRSGALVRLGATVVHRSPNRTLSWLCDTPVERMTVVRTLGSRQLLSVQQPVADGLARPA